MISIINYGLGNLGSILNILKYIGVEAMIIQTPEEILKAEKLILPGVGHFDTGMKQLEERGLKDAVLSRVLNDKVPILGICLGMQLLTNSSEEGSLSGLSLINAETLRFPKNNGLKVPHMGWNLVKPSVNSSLLKNITEDYKFYFVHSYYVNAHNPENAILKTFYGFEFDSAIQNGNIYGVQFHPEKSHKFGMQLLRNFAAL